MTEQQARDTLRRLLRHHDDVQRFQRVMQQLALCEEIKSSAHEQAARHAHYHHAQREKLLGELAAILAGTGGFGVSASTADLGLTSPRV